MMRTNKGAKIAASRMFVNSVVIGILVVLYTTHAFPTGVCCCKGGEPQWGWWSVNLDGYRACIGRCFWPALALIIALGHSALAKMAAGAGASDRA